MPPPTTTTRLFITTTHGGRHLYKLYFTTFLTALLSLFYYRATHIPHDHPLLFLLLTLSELFFALIWLFQQAFRWAPTVHSTYPNLLQSHDLPSIDILICTADHDREPPWLVANTLLSLLGYEYDVGKLAFYLSDDGGSELVFFGVWRACEFARYWLPFCREFSIEPRAPRVYFEENDEVEDGGGGGRRFKEQYDLVKGKYEEIKEQITRATRLRSVPEEVRNKHRGFRNWDSKVDPRDHKAIIEVLLRGNGEDKDAHGNSMPTLVYVSREKWHGRPHHYKAGALNALNRVSALMSNAPLVLNVDCDMHSNNSQALRHAVCFFLDPKEGHRIGYVQFPQSFGGLTENDLYANGVKRIYEIEFLGTNAHNGPMYAGTGSVHRRESLNGRKYDPRVQLRIDDKSDRRSKNWDDLEQMAKELTSSTFETGKPWGKEMGLMYGCAVEDVFTGLVLQSRGWQSVYCTPDRKAYLGVAPANTNDTLIQHKRWSTGLLEIFLSDYCPWTNGVGKLKLGQIMCYSFYTLWALWCLPMLTYALVVPLAMVNGISLFPKVYDPWFIVFAFLGLASHLFSLGELLRAKGTIKMWWNETRMWMMKGTSSYLFSVMVIILKTLGISEAGFEITSKVIDDEAMKRYRQETMEFGVASPMFIPPTTLALLNLVCVLKTLAMVVKDGSEGLDQMFLQVIVSGYISVISLPVYEAMFLRSDRGRIPRQVTVYAVGLVLVFLYLSWILM